MRVRQMFPRKTLDGEDLFAFSPGVTPVTIEKIDYQTGFGQIGEVNIKYYLKVREFKKPFKLTGPNAAQLEKVLGSDDTTHWIGKVVGLIPAQIPVPNPSGGQKLIWVVNIYDQAITVQPTLTANTDITGLATEGSTARQGVPGLAPPAKPALAASNPDMTPIGVDAAAATCCQLEERGKSWDDLRMYLQVNGLGEMVAGKLPAECPRAIGPAVKRFINDFPKVNPKPEPKKFLDRWRPPPATGEVIDKATGEVINPAAGLKGEPPNRVDEEDIPF